MPIFVRHSHPSLLSCSCLVPLFPNKDQSPCLACFRASKSHPIFTSNALYLSPRPGSPYAVLLSLSGFALPLLNRLPFSLLRRKFSVNRLAALAVGLRRPELTVQISAFFPRSAALPPYFFLFPLDLRNGFSLCYIVSFSPTSLRLFFTVYICPSLSTTHLFLFLIFLLFFYALPGHRWSRDRTA